MLYICGVPIDTERPEENVRKNKGIFKNVRKDYWSLHTAKNKIKSNCLDLNMKILRVYDWIIIAVIFFC